MGAYWPLRTQDNYKKIKGQSLEISTSKLGTIRISHFRMKRLAIVTATFASLTTGIALAGTMSSAQLMQYCALGKMANDEGISAKYMFEQTLAKKGNPNTWQM